MEYVRFGSTCLQVSRICLGTMSYGGPSERWPWLLDINRKLGYQVVDERRW